MEPCSQSNRIMELEKQSMRVNLALFGNPNDPNDLGAIELIKEIHATQKEMIPTYNDLNDWATFFRRGRQLGAVLVAIAVGSGILVGTIYAIKEWFRK